VTKTWLASYSHAAAGTNPFGEDRMAADEDDEKLKTPAGFEPPVLDRLSIDELKAYIGKLEAEIKRVEADIAAKEATRQGAEAFFKK
jgi:uncharacterized small protein (DUF1192 family)